MRLELKDGKTTIYDDSGNDITRHVEEIEYHEDINDRHIKVVLSIHEIYMKEEKFKCYFQGKQVKRIIFKNGDSKSYD